MICSKVISLSIHSPPNVLSYVKYTNFCHVLLCHFFVLGKSQRKEKGMDEHVVFPWRLVKFNLLGQHGRHVTMVASSF